MISEGLVFKKGEKRGKNGGFLTQVFPKFWTGGKRRQTGNRGPGRRSTSGWTIRELSGAAGRIARSKWVTSTHRAFFVQVDRLCLSLCRLSKLTILRGPRDAGPRMPTIQPGPRQWAHNLEVTRAQGIRALVKWETIYS
jgi:hypothetical protein